MAKQTNGHSINSENVRKHAGEFQAQYDAANPEGKAALDAELNRYGYADAVAAGAFGNSQFIPNLLIKTNQQLVMQSRFAFTETELQTIEIVANGARYLNYTDIYQGSSVLNNDVYNTTKTGESTDAINPNDDIVLSDFNAKETPVFEEEYKSDTKYSRKLKVPSNLLNDFALTPAIYMGLIKEITKYIASAESIFNFQRLLKFFAEANYNKVFTYPKGTFDTTLDQDVLKDNLKKAFSEWRSFIIGLNTPSRKHLGASGVGAAATIPQGASQPLIFDGKDEEIVILMDVKFESIMNTFLRTGVFNLGELAWPTNVSFKYVNIEIWAEWYPAINSPVNGFGKLFGEGGLPLFVAMSKGAYVEFAFYNGATNVGTPKLFDIATVYAERGQYRNKNKIMFAGGYERQVDQPTYDDEIQALVADVDIRTLIVAGAQPIAPQLLAYLKAYSGAKTVADIAKATVVSTNPTDAKAAATATPATAVISVPVVSGKKADANTSIGISFSYKNSAK